MILLGVQKRDFESNGRKVTRWRGYFARKLSSSEGGQGMCPAFSADFNSDIDVSRLKVGSDYVVETYDYQRVNKETGQIYSFKNVSAIVSNS